MGELPLFGVEVGQGADGPGFGVVGHQIPGVDVLASCLHSGAHRLAVLRPHQAHGPAALPGGGDSAGPGTYHRAKNLMPRLDIRRDGGLFRVDGVVVAQNGGGGDGGVGEVPLVQPQLVQAAHHAVGQHPPQLAPLDLLAAGQGGVMEGHRRQIAHVNVPRPGDDLKGPFPAHIQPAHPHMVAVLVALHGQHTAHHHIFDLRPQLGGALHLGAGQGHGLGKLPVGHIYLDKFIEPLTA